MGAARISPPSYLGHFPLLCVPGRIVLHNLPWTRHQWLCGHCAVDWTRGELVEEGVKDLEPLGWVVISVEPEPRMSAKELMI